MSKIDIASYIDHTLLKPIATLNDVKMLCNEAKKFGFKAVCVNPCYVSFAYSELIGSGIKVCTVVGFPLGASETDVKIAEAIKAIKSGADEIDMVINIGFLKSGLYDKVKADIEEVLKAVKKERADAILKVIIETCFLSQEEKKNILEIIEEVGADFAKTSTGFGTHGATLDDVKLMKSVLKNTKIKASGGIKTLKDVLAMIEAGADRIGTSSGVKIMEELNTL